MASRAPRAPRREPARRPPTRPRPEAWSAGRPTRGRPRRGLPGGAVKQARASPGSPALAARRSPPSAGPRAGAQSATASASRSRGRARSRGTPRRAARDPPAGAAGPSAVPAAAAAGRRRARGCRGVLTERELPAGVRGGERGTSSVAASPSASSRTHAVSSASRACRRVSRPGRRRRTRPSRCRRGCGRPALSRRAGARGRSKASRTLVWSPKTSPYAQLPVCWTVRRSSATPGRAYPPRRVRRRPRRRPSAAPEFRARPSRAAVPGPGGCSGVPPRTRRAAHRTRPLGRRRELEVPRGPRAQSAHSASRRRWPPRGRDRSRAASPRAARLRRGGGCAARRPPLRTAARLVGLSHSLAALGRPRGQSPCAAQRR